MTRSEGTSRRLPGRRRPVSPGQVFLEDFLVPLGLTQKEAAARLRISYPRMNEIVNGKRSVTPETALRLGRLTGTEPEFWLNLQQAVDLWDAIHSSDRADIEKIRPLPYRPPNSALARSSHGSTISRSPSSQSRTAIRE